MSGEIWNPATRVGFCLEPLDVLFFRDGRPFDASSRAYGGLPMPRTIAGALRTAMLTSGGFHLAALRSGPRDDPNGHRDPTTRQLLESKEAPRWVLEACFRGPWLALLDERPGGNPALLPLLPVPATLARVQPEDRNKPGTWFRSRLGPSSLPGWSDPDLLPLWRRGDPDAKHPGGFLTPDGIGAFLRGENPDDTQWYKDEELFGYDVRTGIGIDADTLTAATSQIYGVRMLALRTDVEIKGREGRRGRVVLYEEVLLPDGSPSLEELGRRLAGPIPLGGEGRHASLKVIEAVEWPNATAEEERSLWLLATPGLFGGHDGHRRADRPDAIALTAKLRAAASGSPLAVSGWDIAMNGPRPTRFAVPAGAVYYVEGAFAPSQDSLCSKPELVQEGWGFALRGVWNDG